jgi:DoxX-like family
MRRIAAHAAVLPLAAFLGFVGWHKTFSPLADLAVYGSWTVHLWEPLGRLVGLSEMACALALVLPLVWSGADKARRWACLYFIANQIAAAGVHFAHGESHALPQNALLIALSLLVLWGSRPVQT